MTAGSAAVEAKGLLAHAGSGRAAPRLFGPLDLRVDSGEHLLLVGRSGSGKTSLLRALAGLTPLRAGHLALFGRPVADGPRELVPPQHRGIGFVFQGGALWPHLSAGATLDFVLRHAGVPRSERARRRGELLEWVELVGFEPRLPGTLSGGEAQRLALARALAGRPRLLLLDEPLGPLDSQLRRALLAKLGELHRRLGLTVVHVTHDPQEAHELASRTLCMEHGALLDAAPAAPAHADTRKDAP